MDELQKQVRKVQWRLAWQRFLGALGWWCAAMLVVALGTVLADKIWPMVVPVWVWPAAAMGLGVLGAGVWAVVRSRGPLDAAIEIDHRFGLKERVSSALALAPEERATEMGQAVIADARRRVERLEVSEQFRVAPPRQLLLPLLPGVAVALVVFLVPSWVAEQKAQATPTAAQARERVRKPAEDLKRQLAQRRKEAEKQGLQDAELLFKKLEEGTRELERSDGDRKQALVKLNDLTRQVQEERNKVGGAEQVKQQLEQFKNLDRGPAEQFAKALGEGDFKQAMQELDKLKQQLAAGEMKQEDQQKLAQQMEKMQQKLQEMLDAQKKAQEELQKQLDQAKAAGDSQRAQQVQQQLDKLKQQAPQRQKMQQMCDKMGQCANCMRNGQGQAAAQALGEMQGELGDLQEQLEQIEMLDEAMEQLCQAKDQMNCPQCGGKGCNACMGKGDGKGKKPGMGLGRGRGQGDRPEAETDSQFYDSQVRQKLDRGSASVVDLVHGPNVRGDVEQEIQVQVEASRTSDVDPLTDQRLPQEHRKHAQEYFDRFREGE